MSRDEFMAGLRSRNIGTGLHFRAVHTHSWYQAHPERWRGEVPDTEWSSERILSLPLFPDMTAGDVEDVVAAVREVLSVRGSRGGRG